MPRCYEATVQFECYYENVPLGPKHSEGEESNDDIALCSHWAAGGSFLAGYPKKVLGK